MDACFNSHALRQFEADEAEKERRLIDAEETAFSIFADAARDPERLDGIISEYDIDITPLVSLLYQPLPRPEQAQARIAELKSAVIKCFLPYIQDLTNRELGE
jgi:hypothetical protein